MLDEGDTGFNLSVDGEEWKSLPIDIEFLHRKLRSSLLQNNRNPKPLLL